MSRTTSDEHYVLDLCDAILGLAADRQRTFDFLRGDPGKRGIGHRLRVDAYYPTLNLVIEYREHQHTEPVAFFDKPDRLTVSGVPRGEQRRLYDERRREILPAQGIAILEISYSDFDHSSARRLRRNPAQDEQILRRKLAPWLQQSV